MEEFDNTKKTGTPTPFESFENQQAGEKPGRQELDLRSQDEIDEQERLNPTTWKDAEDVVDMDVSFETYGEPAEAKEDDPGETAGEDYYVEGKFKEAEIQKELAEREIAAQTEEERLRKELLAEQEDGETDHLPHREGMRGHMTSAERTNSSEIRDAKRRDSVHQNYKLEKKKREWRAENPEEAAAKKEARKQQKKKPLLKRIGGWFSDDNSNEDNKAA